MTPIVLIYAQATTMIILEYNPMRSKFDNSFQLNLACLILRFLVDLPASTSVSMLDVSSPSFAFLLASMRFSDKWETNKKIKFYLPVSDTF